jgi:hypothetical protein
MADTTLFETRRYKRLGPILSGAFLTLRRPGRWTLSISFARYCR